MFLLNCRESFEKSDAEKTLELSQEKKFSLSGGLLNKLIMTVARRGSKDEVGELIGIVKSTYPNLEFEEIKTHGELKALENDLIQSLEKYSQVNKNELNVHHFTTILNTCLKLNSLDFWNIYKDFKQTKLKPNMALYTVLTRYYFVNDKINEARKLFQDITDGEAKINLHYANVMIHGLMENDLVDEAVGIYNMFGTWNLIPDAVTFGILISHCTSRRMYRAAYGFYKQMTDLQVKYSLELRCTILKMFCDLNEMEMAEAFFKQLKESHEPSTFSYCILMRGHVGAKNYQRVLELYNEMIENGLPESELSRRYLIVSCAGIPTLSDRVLELYSVSYKLALEEYEKNGIPDTELIGLYLRLAGCFKSKPQLVKMLYKDMWFLGLPQSKLFNYLITSSIIHKRTADALRFSKRLERSNEVYSKLAYRKLLSLYCDIERWEVAVNFIIQQSANGHVPTSAIMARILSNYMNDSTRFEELITLFDRIPWNYETFLVAIMFHSKRKNSTKAKKYLEKYFAQCSLAGQRPSMLCILPFRNACIQERKDDYLNELLGYIKRFDLDRNRFMNENCSSLPISKEEFKYFYALMKKQI